MLGAKRLAPKHSFLIRYFFIAKLFTGTLPFPQKTQRPYIALAPMEGVMDYNLRDILSSVGGIDHCVTEFIRVVDHLYPEKVFYRFCPELKTGGRTASGTPVHVQLLGSNPETMAANAQKVAALGAPAIDLNFGCPAKTVNNSQGGAVLLKDPELLHKIALAVRQAVPAEIPVSAKIRLGYLDKSLALDNSQALADAGIQWLTVHARTKCEGYKPPAYWHLLAPIQEKLRIPVLANGEIWTPEDAKRCMNESGCDLLMIGRGLVSMPDLGRQIHSSLGQDDHQAHSVQQQLQLFMRLVPKLAQIKERSALDRLKQWLFYFTRHYPEITQLFAEVKREQELAPFLARCQSLLD